LLINHKGRSVVQAVSPPVSCASRALKQELAIVPPRHLKEVDSGSVPTISRAILASYGLVVTDQCRLFRVADKTFRICDVARHP